MSAGTKIEWADDTVNPWWGCTRISPGCEHCYAETLARRFGVQWGPTADRRSRVDAALGELRQISRRALHEGRPRRVFIASMADVFEFHPSLAGDRDAFLGGLRDFGPNAGIVPMILTKRPTEMAAWAGIHGWPQWWWAGTTVEDQRRADERIPWLLQVPAPVRFLSCEPLLGPVSLPLRHLGRRRWIDDSPEDDAYGHGMSLVDGGINWIIVGGESGPKARPMHQDWARSLRDQCESAGVAFFMKQMSAHAGADKTNIPDDLRILEFPHASR